jgi:23S rRNA-intervening sequence protein
MAYYKDLPLWRDAMRLAVEMEIAVRHFPRYHKYTLGTELRQAAHHICQDVAHAAQWALPRLQTLQRLVERIEALKISVQLAKELRAFTNFAQFQRIVELAVSVGRQSGGWLKRVRSTTNEVVPA